MIEPGLSAATRDTVTVEMTAERVGSGDVAVLATPAILALVERATVAAVDGSLEPGTTSVGSRVELDHLAPTPMGVEVEARVTLDEVEGRRLRFSFTVSDQAGEIATGTHVRVVVDRDRFLETARARS